MYQIICIKFCVKNKIKGSEVLKMLITAFCIYFEPKKCLYVVEKILMTKPILDAPAFQQPMKTFEAVEKTIMENRQIAIREVVEDVGISFGLLQLFPVSKIEETLERKEICCNRSMF